MSEPSDFKKVTSNVTSQSIEDDLNDVNTIETNNSDSKKSEIIGININDITSIFDTPQHDVSLTDSDHSQLEVPKLFNASSPSSICSIKPLEWDSGADVGYDLTSKQLNQDMNTIERIAVSSLVYNANSTPIDYEKNICLKTKCNSLINLNEIEWSKEKKSASFETLKLTGVKSDTLPKCRSPMNSSLSVSTVIHQLESLNTKRINRLNQKHIDTLFEQQEKRFEKLNIDSNKECKSSDSSKESNSTLGSADTAGSWVAREFHDSTNTTTDRVNSFEYLPGNTYYNDQKDKLDDYSDKEIKQRTKMLVEAMKQNGLTNEIQREKIFKKIVGSLKNYIHNDNSSSIKSSTGTDQSPIRHEFTSQTSNTVNTIVNNQKNNQSSTITFTSPFTSSQYGDEIDSKYDEFSMDSGRHINLQKCKSKKSYSTNKQKNQGVQCSIQDGFKNSDVNVNSKQSEFSKSKIHHRNVENMETYPKKHNQSKTDYSDVNKEFKKQMVWFHKNYMKTERENQMLWINNQISHLNNLKKLLNTHEELKRNWNTYKQKQTTTNKPKLRRSLIPMSNSSTDNISTTTKTTDSTISSKVFSVSSKCDETDAESSSTICNHVHYKKGVLVIEPKSIQKCCETTLHQINEKQEQNAHMFKTVGSQTKSNNDTEFNNNQKDLNKSDTTYTVDRKLKPISSKNSISYDIIFKPNVKGSKERNIGDDLPKKQTKSISVACQTSEIPFKSKSSLQEYLIENRPDYICRAEERQNILSDLANLRNERKKLKTKLLITNSIEKKIPPNPLAVKRIMSQREMRKQTERKYRKCPEVKNKKVEIKRKEEYKTNKIMANIFNKRLQKKTLRGNVDLSNSISVCSL